MGPTAEDRQQPRSMRFKSEGFSVHVHSTTWIPHYAHIADPLYHLLRKGKNLEWKPEHTKAMNKLKKTLRRAEALKEPSYDQPIIVTVDTSPTEIGWVINQADSDGS